MKKTKNTNMNLRGVMYKMVAGLIQLTNEQAKNRLLETDVEVVVIEPTAITYLVKPDPTLDVILAVINSYDEEVEASEEIEQKSYFIEREKLFKMLDSGDYEGCLMTTLESFEQSLDFVSQTPEN